MARARYARRSVQRMRQERGTRRKRFMSTLYQQVRRLIL
jgi:hypothetical protein